MTPPEAAVGFNRAIESSRLVWFDNCGHVPMVEKPEEFAALMLEFAAGLEAKK